MNYTPLFIMTWLNVLIILNVLVESLKLLHLPGGEDHQKNNDQKWWINPSSDKRSVLSARYCKETLFKVNVSEIENTNCSPTKKWNDRVRHYVREGERKPKRHNGRDCQFPKNKGQIHPSDSVLVQLQIHQGRWKGEPSGNNNDVTGKIRVKYPFQRMFQPPIRWHHSQAAHYFRVQNSKTPVLKEKTEILV